MNAAARAGWQVWDRVSIYLPIILMGLMALGTYWLVRNTPVAGEALAGRAPTHEPDYFMRNFSVRAFDPTGLLKSEVFGAEARHYPDTDTLEIDHPRIRTLNESSQLARATADKALTNGDATEVQLLGNARVVRDGDQGGAGRPVPPMVFTGEFLHVYVNTERVTSHRPVTLTRGADRFSADRMDYNNLDRVMQLHGQVRVVLAPAHSR